MQIDSFDRRHTEITVIQSTFAAYSKSIGRSWCEPHFPQRAKSPHRISETWSRSQWILDLEIRSTHAVNHIMADFQIFTQQMCRKFSNGFVIISIWPATDFIQSMFNVHPFIMGLINFQANQLHQMYEYTFRYIPISFGLCLFFLDAVWSHFVQAPQSQINEPSFPTGIVSNYTDTQTHRTYHV